MRISDWSSDVCSSDLPIAVQATLADLKKAGAKAVAMEVSSHGLDQGRVTALAFDVAVLTNLSRDHLDYHGTMQAYGEAKARLFAWNDLKCRVLNLDDAFGRQLAADKRERSDERRVGKECVSTGKFRWSPET